ncbi:potassium/proton antiporter [Alicyclobacillus acidiphilus]|uniref:potassium/proton antiporter n=1 Tax=Alicyclobacillus acidiphilus TaxID=182455 RepID=UPI001FDFB8F7|nr:potassium/proton antiporter [Alicyclobacillus acidiphilus]
MTLMVAIVLLAGVLLARANKRFGFPALISFVAVGSALASLVPGVLENITPKVAKDLSYLALAFILFEGGLHTSARRVQRVWRPAMSLATIGVLISSAIMTGFAHMVLGISWVPAAMLGVAASSTDAASVFSVLGNTSLRRRLTDVLEVESGTNDPMSFFLITILMQWIHQPHLSISEEIGRVIVLFCLEMAVGLVIGVVIGLLASYVNRYVKLDTGGLYPTLSLGFALLSFGLAQSLYGSGFLAVYVTGVVMSSRQMEHRYTIVRFHEGLAWTMHVLMFVVLGFFLVPRDFAYVFVPGVALAAAALLVARPVAVWISTIGMRFTIRERAFIAWAGLRGAAPIVLILSAVESEVTGYIVMIEVVFFIVIASTLIQGLTVQPLSEKFDLVDATPSEDIVDLLSLTRETALVVPVEIAADSPYVEKRLSEVRFPENTLCYGVVRGSRVVVPRGSTRLRVGDHLLVIAEMSQVAALKAMFDKDQVGQATMLP